MKSTRDPAKVGRGTSTKVRPLAVVEQILALDYLDCIPLRYITVATRIEYARALLASRAGPKPALPKSLYNYNADHGKGSATPLPGAFRTMEQIADVVKGGLTPLWILGGHRVHPGLADFLTRLGFARTLAFSDREKDEQLPSLSQYLDKVYSGCSANLRTSAGHQELLDDDDFIDAMVKEVPGTDRHWWRTGHAPQPPAIANRAKRLEDMLHHTPDPDKLPGCKPTRKPLPSWWMSELSALFESKEGKRVPLTIQKRIWNIFGPVSPDFIAAESAWRQAVEQAERDEVHGLHARDLQALQDQYVQSQMVEVIGVHPDMVDAQAGNVKNIIKTEKRTIGKK